MQGVTTEIFNADGGGAADLEEQLPALKDAGLAINIGGYIGFNAVWQTVVGNTDRRPNPEEIERMRGMINEALGYGAWGVSAGLDYKPGYFARTEEVIKVVDVARPMRTNFTNHDRITPESNFSSRTGVNETIAIGQKAGLVPVVTHMKAQGREQGTAGDILASMRQATRRGHYTAADAYPYLAGQSGLGALMIPAWAQEGGREAMLKRFADPEQRARIITGNRSGDDRALRRPAGRLPAAHAAGADRGDEGDERRPGRDRAADHRAGRPRRDPAVRDRGRPDQDPAGPGDVDGVRLRRLDRRRARTRVITDRSRACSDDTCASRRSCRGSRRSERCPACLPRRSEWSIAV